MMNPARFVNVVGLKLAFLVFLLAYSGAIAGMADAEAGPEAFEETHANLTSTVESASENVTGESAGGEVFTTATGLGTIISVFQTVTVTSHEFGYRHPTLAAWYSRLSPLVVLVGVSMYAYGSYRSYRRSG